MQRTIPAYNMPVLERVSTRNRAVLDRQRKLSNSKRLVFLDSPLPTHPSVTPIPLAPPVLPVAAEHEAQARVRLDRMRRIYVKKKSVSERRTLASVNQSYRTAVEKKGPAELPPRPSVRPIKSRRLGRRAESQAKPKSEVDCRRTSGQRYSRKQEIEGQWYRVNIERTADSFQFNIEATDGSELYELALGQEDAREYFSEFNYDLSVIASYLTKRNGRVELVLPETVQGHCTSMQERRRDWEEEGGQRRAANLSLNASSPRTNPFRTREEPKFSLQQYTICEEEEPDSPHKLNYAYEESLEEQVF